MHIRQFNSISRRSHGSSDARETIIKSYTKNNSHLISSRVDTELHGGELSSIEINEIGLANTSNDNALNIQSPM